MKCLVESRFINNWDENDSGNFADSDDAHILLKWGGH